MLDDPPWRRELLRLEADGVVSRTFRRLDPPRQLAVVTALLQVAAEHGPGAVNVRAVASRAGVSVGSLYQYFPRRETMLDFAARVAASLLVESLAQFEAPLAELPLREALEAYLAGGTAWSAEHAALLTFFARAAYSPEMGYSAQLVRPVAEALQGLIRAILTAARDRGELRPDVDLEAAVRLVHGLCITVSDVALLPGLNEYFLLVDDRLPVPELHRQAVETICRAFCAPAPTPSKEAP